MKMKFCGTLIASVITGATLLATAEEVAIVKGNRVNVRGQAKLDSEVVTQVKKGETVTILEEVPDAKAKNGKPANWAKIVLPANTPVWVNAAFIKEGAVAVNKLNVRSGPGESFSVVARLEKGAAVKSLRVVDGWMEIEAPKGSTAYVSMDQLTRQETKPEAVAATAATKPASTPAPVPAPAPETVKVETAPAPVAAKDETKVAAATPVPAPVPAPPPAPAPVTKPIADPAPIPSAGTDAKAATAAAQPEEKKGFWSWLTGKGKKTTPATDEKPKTEAAKTAAVDAEPLPKRIVTREGIVRRSLNIQAPTDYYLEDLESGKNINYLFTTVTNMPWKALKGQTVVVTGEEGLDSRWPKTPVLKIETLKTTP